MLLSSERPRPCMAFARELSPSRSTITLPSSTRALVRCGNCNRQLALGALDRDVAVLHLHLDLGRESPLAFFRFVTWLLLFD